MKTCAICGKGYLKGNTRSHSNIATKVRREPNLQLMSLDGKRQLVCTKCRKTRTKKGKI